MTRAARHALIVALLMTPLALAAQDTTSTPGPRSIMSGVFSQDQADRGRASHRANCTSCHGSSKYVGEDFAKLFVGSTVFEILDRIRTTMPDDNPGGLPLQDYVDILAYIFNLNGYPQGAEDLPTDEAALRNMTVDTPPPPKAGDLVRGWALPHARQRVAVAIGHGR